MKWKQWCIHVLNQQPWSSHQLDPLWCPNHAHHYVKLLDINCAILLARLEKTKKCIINQTFIRWITQQVDCKYRRLFNTSDRNPNSSHNNKWCTPALGTDNRAQVSEWWEKTLHIKHGLIKRMLHSFRFKKKIKVCRKWWICHGWMDIIFDFSWSIIKDVWKHGCLCFYLLNYSTAWYFFKNIGLHLMQLYKNIRIQTKSFILFNISYPFS